MNAPLRKSEAWPLVNLRDIADLCLGKMLDAQKNRGRLHPYLRNPNVRWFELDLSDIRTMPFEDHEETRFGLEKGDVLVCEGGEAGRAAIWDGSISGMKFQKAIHRVRCGPQLFNRYLAHRLRYDYFGGRLSDYYTGATIKHLTGRDLGRYTFPLPPVREQRRIAAILDKADALRAKRRAALAQLDTLTQSIFLDMFGDPASNPKHLPIVALRQVFAAPPIYGTMTPPGESGEWLSLRVANIQDWQLDLSDRKFVTLSKIAIERHEVQDGDVLLARAIASREHLGKAIVAYPAGDKWAFDSHLMRLRFDQAKALPEVVRHLFMTPGGRSLFLKATRRTAVQFNINTKEMSALRVPLAPIDLQWSFVRSIGAVNAQRVLGQCSLAELDTLFASLQHRAFNGTL